MMQNPGDLEGYFQNLAPPSNLIHHHGWSNAATTESGLEIVLSYRPLSNVESIPNSLPVLYVAAEEDTLCPASYIEKAHQRTPNSELLFMHNTAHFDVYNGDELTQVLAREVAFFKKHLLV